MRYLIGMDIGGSNIRLGAVNAADNSLIGRCNVLSSDVLAGCADPAEVIFRLICDHLKEQGLAKEELRGIGIGIPGSVFHDFSTVNEVPNIPGNHFRGLNLGKELGKKLKKPVFVDKDVNLLLRADMHILDLSGTVLAVYIGTGIGMAVSINGEILYGTDGFAMDAGHMPVYHAEGICGCG